MGQGHFIKKNVSRSLNLKHRIIYISFSTGKKSVISRLPQNPLFFLQFYNLQFGRFQLQPDQNLQLNGSAMENQSRKMTTSSLTTPQVYTTSKLTRSKMNTAASGNVSPRTNTARPAVVVNLLYWVSRSWSQAKVKVIVQRSKSLFKGQK